MKPDLLRAIFVVREFALVASPSAHVFQTRGMSAKCIQVHANWACASAANKKIRATFPFREVVSCSIESHVVLLTRKVTVQEATL